MLQIQIIGGGIHGFHLAHCLLQQSPLTHDDIRILDPHDELLHEWRRCTRNYGMCYLSSPSVHHIDIDPFSLDKYGAVLAMIPIFGAWILDAIRQMRQGAENPISCAKFQADA